MSDMLKKSQKINASEKCVKSDNLTELWKEGKLPEGWYYVKLKISDVIEIDRCMINDGKMFRYSYFENETEISEVLAPVPSYEEWQASEKYNKHLEEVIKVYERKEKQHTDDAIAYNELAKENEELKEILERHKKATARAQIRSCDLEIINTQLKELLKECKDEIEYLRKHYKGRIDHFKNNTRLDKEINQALVDKINEVLR